jgi:hypothetical protein
VSAPSNPGTMPVAVTVAADVSNRRQLMLNGKSALAIMPSCRNEGWRSATFAVSSRPHPRFRENHRACEAGW